MEGKSWGPGETVDLESQRTVLSHLHDLGTVKNALKPKGLERESGRGVSLGPSDSPFFRNTQDRQ